MNMSMLVKICILFYMFIVVLLYLKLSSPDKVNCRLCCGYVEEYEWLMEDIEMTSYVKRCLDNCVC